MRDIRFRAWDEKNNKMEYNNSSNPFFEAECWWDLGFKIMQYTGFKDKKGKEDYHKDICKYKDESGTEQIGIIEEECGCWKLIAIGGDDEGNQNIELFDTEHENIGNIYENKEKK